jgi:isoleucyl-tRNA synthetase
LQEGLARDFNRMLQDQRKALNLDISDHIVVTYSASQRIAEAIAKHEAFLRNELLAERLERSATPNDRVRLALGGEDVFVTITRV